MILKYHTEKKLSASSLRRLAGIKGKTVNVPLRLASFFQKRGFLTKVVFSPRMIAGKFSWRKIPRGDITRKIFRCAKKRKQNDFLHYLKTGGKIEARPLSVRELSRALEMKCPPILCVDTLSFYWGAIDGGKENHAVVPVAVNEKSDIILVNDPNGRQPSRFYLSQTMRACHLSLPQAIFISPPRSSAV